jgi:hypothetical protein
MGWIDESDPGSDTDGGVSDGSLAQLPLEDTLLDRGVDDVLDEGYSPPDRELAIDVPTPAEEERGESLDQRLSEEEPDVGAVPDVIDPYGDDSAGEVGEERSGRLVDTGGDLLDTEKDLLAQDVGIDGAGASAEEAAMHVIDEYDQR